MLQRFKQLYQLQVTRQLPVEATVLAGLHQTYCTHQTSLNANFLEWQMHYTVYGLGEGTYSVQCFQEEGRAFSTPEELLQAVHLYNLTQRTFRSELQVR